MRRPACRPSRLVAFTLTTTASLLLSLLGSSGGRTAAFAFRACSSATARTHPPAAAIGPLLLQQPPPRLRVLTVSSSDYCVCAVVDPTQLCSFITAILNTKLLTDARCRLHPPEQHQQRRGQRRRAPVAPQEARCVGATPCLLSSSSSCRVVSCAPFLLPPSHSRTLDQTITHHNAGRPPKARASPAADEPPTAPAPAAAAEGKPKAKRTRKAAPVKAAAAAVDKEKEEEAGGGAAKGKKPAVAAAAAAKKKAVASSSSSSTAAVAVAVETTTTTTTTSSKAAAKPKAKKGAAAPTTTTTTGRTTIPRTPTPRAITLASPSTLPLPPGRRLLRLLSWNVAGLRGLLRKPHATPALRALLERERPDVLCLQETKLQDDHVAEVSAALRQLHLPRFEGNWHWCGGLRSFLGVFFFLVFGFLSVYNPLSPPGLPIHPIPTQTQHKPPPPPTHPPKKKPTQKQLRGQKRLLRHRRPPLPGQRPDPGARGRHLRDRAGGGGRGGAGHDRGLEGGGLGRGADARERLHAQQRGEEEGGGRSSILVLFLPFSILDCVCFSFFL